jgi:hypothetical protein
MILAFAEAERFEASRQRWKIEMRPVMATAETSKGSATVDGCEEEGVGLDWNVRPILGELVADPP